MTDSIKALIKLHCLILCSLLISSYGVYFYNENIGSLYFSMVTSTTPISLIITTFIVAHKEEKNVK